MHSKFLALNNLSSAFSDNVMTMSFHANNILKYKATVS